MEKDKKKIDGTWASLYAFLCVVCAIIIILLPLINMAKKDNEIISEESLNISIGNAEKEFLDFYDENSSSKTNICSVLDNKILPINNDSQNILSTDLIDIDKNVYCFDNSDSLLCEGLHIKEVGSGIKILFDSVTEIEKAVINFVGYEIYLGDSSITDSTISFIFDDVTKKEQITVFNSVISTIECVITDSINEFDIILSGLIEIDEISYTPIIGSITIF